MWEEIFADETFKDKRKVVRQLLDSSHVGSEYFFLLTVSTILTTLGLVVNNTAVVIGGMLIAPLLSPVLALGLGFTTANPESLFRSAKAVAQSVIMVVFLSAFVAFFMGVDVPLNQEIGSRVGPSLIYMYIAILAGIGASFAWAKPKLSVHLPAIAVVVALLPPLCVTGIGISLLDREIITGSFELFFINLIGVAISSAVIFSLFGFHSVRRFEKKEIKKELSRDEYKKEIRKKS